MSWETLKAADLNWRYPNLRVKSDDLKAAVEGARAMNFRGFNVTIYGEHSRTVPHKIVILPLLHSVAAGQAWTNGGSEFG